MDIFGGKKEKPDLRFTTRAEAFAYMLSYQLEKGKEPMEAAKQANEFADIFATNMGIPTNKAPEPEGVDKYLSGLDKIVCYCDEHPRVLDFLSGVATFAIGAIFGRNEKQENPSPNINKIDINQLD